MFHGTDLRFVKMTKEERTEYLNNCKKIIDYLWDIFLPLYIKVEVTQELPNGEKIIVLESRLKQFCIEKGQNCLYGNLFRYLSIVESIKNKSPFYEYKYICFTSGKKRAEKYALDAKAGGEIGFIAYNLIKGAELLNLIDDSLPKDLESIITAIKYKAESDTPVPVVFEVDDLELQYLIYETSNKPVDCFIEGEEISYKYTKEYTFNFDKMYML